MQREGTGFEIGKWGRGVVHITVDPEPNQGRRGTAMPS